MGFYDWLIAEQFDTARNHVSIEEAFALNHGGEVLVVTNLPTWETCECMGCDMGPQRDQNEQLVTIPLVLEALPPNTIVQAGYDYRAKKSVGIMLVDQMADQGSDPYAVPHYMGLAIAPTKSYSWEHDTLMEEPSAFPYWAGTPIVFPDLVMEIVAGVARQIGESEWEALSYLSDRDVRDDDQPTAAECWQYHYAPEQLDPSLEDLVLEHAVNYEDEMKSDADSYHRMVQLGLLRYDADPNWEPAPLVFPPVNDFLSPAAQLLWSQAIRKRRTYHQRWQRTGAGVAAARHYTDMDETG